ncbi:MAG: ABC transporter ATP-binding protein, partial [Cyclobacteriaceae bacterium]
KEHRCLIRLANNSFSLLKIENLTVKNLSGKILLNVSLSIEKGGVFALAGLGGCGKSVLMRTIGGMLNDDFTWSAKELCHPSSVHYFPQKEHPFVRFPTGLKADEQSFFKNFEEDTDAEKLVLLDEPTDSASWRNFLRKIKGTESHLAILATHNQNTIKESTDNVIIMKEGEIYKILDTQAFFSSNDNYVKFLLNMGF